MAVPVTVLSGTLGAGKTTLLNHVLTSEHDYEAAVLVNDMGEVNIDADLVERRVDDGEVVELSNGCICCGMQGELEQAVTDLALNEEFDYLLVEPSGISEPKPVAQQFVQGRAAGFYELDSVATVVNAREFYDAFGDGSAEYRGEDDGERPLSDLIVEGVEFCDTLVVNKTDLVSEEELESVLGTLQTLQPEAELLVTEFGDVEVGEILDTGRFDAREVDSSAGWKQAIDEHTPDEDDPHDGHSHGEDGSNEHSHDHEHEEHSHDHEHEEHSHDHEHEEHSHDHDDHDHAHPPEVYGVDSFVYHRRRPMHPERLAEMLSNLPDGVIRAKGLLHVAGRPDHAMDLSVAGQQAYVDVSGRWVASLSEVRQENYRQSRDIDWDEQWGDRETQLVVIGQGMDEAAVEDALDACLCTDGELEAEYDDNPFPRREGEELAL